MRIYRLNCVFITHNVITFLLISSKILPLTLYWDWAKRIVRETKFWDIKGWTNVRSIRKIPPILNISAKKPEIRMPCTNLLNIHPFLLLDLSIICIVICPISLSTTKQAARRYHAVTASIVYMLLVLGSSKHRISINCISEPIYTGFLEKKNPSNLFYLIIHYIGTVFVEEYWLFRKTIVVERYLVCLS